MSAGERRIAGPRAARLRIGGALARLEPRERRVLALIALAVLALHLAGFLTLIALVVPRRYALGGGGAFTIGIGLTAYTLGLRHAFDADHISAIDNTTRKLMADGRRPLSVGFWFSLGHSSVVFALSLLLALGIRSLSGPVRDGGSSLHRVGSWVGTLVSGGFLYLIAALNIVVLLGIIKVFREMRAGVYDERTLEQHLARRGLMNRIFGGLSRRVVRPRQMYGVGVLFGLGFDTASEVALLVLAAGAAGAGLPWYAILCLPLLFAAGMSLMDTLDGSFMNFAYGWAFSQPVRKVYYNLAITGLSVVLAVVIGTIELGGIISRHLGLSGSFWGWLQGIDINLLGFIIVGLFVLTWALALAVWRIGRIEERWSARAPAAGAEQTL